jgi:protoporphyrinogen/coproporphyrinogen III oxidase
VSISDRTVCVIGGGIAGLVSAYTLAREEPELNVVVCESSDRLGGLVRTDSIEGVPIEAGADSFLTRDSIIVELCRELGLDGDLVAPAVFGGSVWVDGRLVELPSGFVLGMPASSRAALRARVLTVPGRLRAALEPLLPGPRVDADESVGHLVRRRFGSEVLERVVDPLLAGTRAGRVDEMSVEAALPAVWSATRGRRSVARALGNAPAPPGPPPFMTIKGGLGRLVDALSAACEHVELRTGALVASIAEGDAGFRVETSTSAVDCSAVIAALPAFESARLLAGARPEAATLLGSIEHASVATVVLVYPPGAGSPPAGTSGLLVPSSEGKTMSACTWYSTKWPEARPSDGGLVLRCFVGRAGANPAIELGDDELIAQVSSEVAAAIGLSLPHRSARITRWHQALPQYTVGHAGRVTEIERLLAQRPGIWVTGGSYRGSGLPDTVRHAQATARSALHWLRAVG